MLLLRLILQGLYFSYSTCYNTPLRLWKLMFAFSTKQYDSHHPLKRQPVSMQDAIQQQEFQNSHKLMVGSRVESGAKLARARELSGT